MSLITETGKSYFYQWDTNQVLIVEGEPNCREVHFGYRDGSFARVCQIREEDGRRVVDIPNELLQKDRTFFVYPISGEEDDAPMRSQSFVVLLRPKPDDYVHTEPEMQTYEALEERITALEENGGTGSGTIKTVNGVGPDENGNVVITIPDAEVEIPNALPNPNALTLTGAVEATYDGSKAVSVEIPSGGNENLQLLFEITTTEEVRSIRSGVNPANYKEIFMVCTAMPVDTTKTTHFDWIFGSVPFRITNSLHNTQERVHVFHAKKLSDESGIWEIGLGLGLRSKGGGTVKTIDEMGFTAIDVKEKYGKVYVFNNDLAADIGCEAYLYGETNLAIGAELRVYGR